MPTARRCESCVLPPTPRKSLGSVIAGALLTPDTLVRAWQREMNPRRHLDDNDGHGFFQALGDSVVTGPTLTNVNDFRAIVISAPNPKEPQ